MRPEFLEVQRWTEMSPAEKRATWRRITSEGTAWRFNHYAERGGNADRVRRDPDAATATVAPGASVTPPRSTADAPSAAAA